MNDNSVRAFGPGRVNLIGEHTDYNGGLALPFAIAEGVTVTATPLDGDRVEAIAHDLGGERDAFALDTQPDATRGWRAFVRGTVAELLRAGHALRPVRLEITATLARGSGLSSSAALEVALAYALLAAAGIDPDAQDPADLARLCARVENDWVGAQTGLLDQTAALQSRAGTALRIDFTTMSVAPIPLDLHGWTLVTADSGQSHSLDAAEGYNQRRAECDEACRRLDVPTLSAATPDQAQTLPNPLDRRAHHVLAENARVDDTIAALDDQDLQQVAALLTKSHNSLRDLYDASTPAVEDTIERLLDHGAAGARMVGGGFGGHVLALFPPNTPPPPGTHAVTPSPGARLLLDD